MHNKVPRKSIDDFSRGYIDSYFVKLTLIITKSNPFITLSDLFCLANVNVSDTLFFLQDR